ncbi:MAG: hypothetical protein ABI921_00710 [Panacibacter sp.]
MKKIILAAVLLVSISSLQASPLTNAASFSISQAARNNAPIPQPCIDAYHAMFPGATTLKWARKGEGVYQVTFIYNGNKSTARYSAAGVYLGK